MFKEQTVKFDYVYFEYEITLVNDVITPTLAWTLASLSLPAALPPNYLFHLPLPNA